MRLLEYLVILCICLVKFSSVSGYTLTRVHCYQCVSTHPGCADFNWFFYWSQVCPEENDKCVKIIERKGAEEIITRDCLSSVRNIRTDIPADHYEGCRPAAHDIRLAQYVNNSIRELDVKRNHYDTVDWCFCYFDNRCNNSPTLVVSATVLITSLMLSFWNFL